MWRQRKPCHLASARRLVGTERKVGVRALEIIRDRGQDTRERVSALCGSVPMNGS